jgi:hypothetical protein
MVMCFVYTFDFLLGLWFLAIHYASQSPMVP